jgi:cytochrome c-type biogenesis protein CcmF
MPVAILFLVIFILMGVAPLVAWRRAAAARLGNALLIPVVLSIVVMLVLLVMGIGILTTIGFGIMAFAGLATILEVYKGTQARHRAHGEPHVVALFKLLQRDRRRYGGYFIHIAIVIMGIGVLASTVYQDVRQRTLNPGDTLELGPYVMQFDQVSRATAIDDREMVVADVSVFRDGEFITNMRPRRDFFSSGSPMSIAGVHSTVEADFYALLTFWEGNSVTFRVYYNPLISFVWLGSLMLVIGTVIAAWPDPEPVAIRRPRRSSVPATVAAGD